MGSFIRVTKYQQEIQHCVLVLPYLIIAGYGKCYLQVMELHRANGIEPVHYLLKTKQNRTKSFEQQSATQTHPAAPNPTSAASTASSPPAGPTASPSHTHTHTQPAHLLQQLLPHKPTQPALLPCSLPQNSLTQCQNPQPLFLQQLANTHAVLPTPHTAHNPQLCQSAQLFCSI